MPRRLLHFIFAMLFVTAAAAQVDESLFKSMKWRQVGPFRGGRVLAVEVCMATPAIRKHIRDHEAHMIHSEIQTGRKHGMQAMDSSLLELYQRADITYDVCLSNARDAEYMRARASGKSLER